jgi:hypothetical protein
LPERRLIKCGGSRKGRKVIRNLGLIKVVSYRLGSQLPVTDDWIEEFAPANRGLYRIICTSVINIC